jgi:hypothetical protein
MQVHPDETLSEFEDRVKRYSTSDDPIGDFKSDGFLRGSPNDRQAFLVNLDRLMAGEARATRDFARWIQVRREFADLDRLLRQSGR